MYKPASAKHVERARALRREATPQERKLWRELRLLKVQGYHFRRQAPFRGYYLDFVEHGARLVIEVDGGQHVDDQKHDEIRDNVLMRFGYLTLRFDNGGIDSGMEGVMEIIMRELEARRDRPPPGARSALRPPHKGGGRLIVKP